MSTYDDLFLSEAREILNSSNSALVGLEKEPDNLDFIHELFRQSHTLKSMAQSMGYGDIVDLAHSMEAALAVLRSRKLQAGRDIIELMFTSLDALGELIASTRNKKARKVDIAPLVRRFEEIASCAVVEPETHAEKQRESSASGRHRSRTDGGAHNASSPVSHSEGQTVRVAVSQLDSLMDAVGELAITRMRLSQISQVLDDNALDEAVAQVSRLTSQLQDQMMKIRLIPLDYIFAPYPRMVRDMAADQNKEIDLVIEGSNVGLDRSIQNEINEPLLHLLKNAVAHGIEERKVREKLKKPVRGKIKLVARRERGFVVIELTDDGKGMDIEEVKGIAVKNGIVTAEELQTMTSEQIMMLATYPGYSGAKEVTKAAGRGVGLNASRAKVESLGGTFAINTRLMEGTTFTIRLPLTMAIAQTMLVGVSDEIYCIPLSYITETIKIPLSKIKTINNQEVISHRDAVLPLIRLGEWLGFQKSGRCTAGLEINTLEPKNTTTELKMVARNAGKPSANSLIPIVIVEERAKKVGLIVDSLLGQEEVVIKPFRGMLSDIKGASGATILGTGKVALVLDVASIV